MDKDTRNVIERATQRARKLLEEDFAAQLEGNFDVHRDGAVAAKAGGHLSARQAFARERIVAAIEHKRAAGMSAADAARDYLRDAAFTTLNRFVALKMLEARDLVQECITKGEQSAGYREFCGMAPGLPLLPESAGYRLYLESLFDELSTEIKVLFDRRDPSSVLWPKRATFEQLLEILNATELARVWGEDETIGWVYQFFNGQDERRKMREESQAPRNSRELAVRNQFFTPRYIVQFLTDNTLGRMWYEMRGTKTVLAERCEYMVRKPGEEFAPRAKKDPRDLRVLDPACGSGHFLLYAFDLLLAIYQEAHADPASPKSEATGKTLAEDYPSLDALRKVVPGLVLSHNLHGVDIDPRCAQIAQLALWMRGQKAYRDFGIGRGDRTQIRHSKIIVAEPLVADEQTAKEFVTRLGDAELGRLFMTLVESLSLAGDMGLLLRVEQLVARQPQRGKTGDLFAPPEERIRGALARFVSEEGGRTSTRRRLFADDAEQGVGLLSLAETKFDVVLMNPPFGDPTSTSKAYLTANYRDRRVDLYKCFVEAALYLCVPNGRVGAISSRTGFFLGQSRGWREDVLLARSHPLLLADLGSGVLDAAVDTAAYVLEERSTTTADQRRMLCFRLLGDGDKELGLKDAVRGLSPLRTYQCSVEDFRRIPNTPFTYWAPAGVLHLFAANPPVESDGRVVRQGLETGDDFRFVRLWWEVSSSSLLDAAANGQPEDYRSASFQGHRWASLAKGGKSGAGRADVHLVINWSSDGHELKAFADGRYEGSGWSRLIQSTEYYFRPSLGFGRRVRKFSVVPMPSGVVFSGNSPGVFGPELDKQLWLGGYLSSDVARCLLGLMTAPRKIEIGYVAALPVPVASMELKSELERSFLIAFRLASSAAEQEETDRTFIAPGLNRDRGFKEPASPSLGSADTQLAKALGVDEADIAKLLVELSSAIGLAEGSPDVVDDDGNSDGDDAGEAEPAHALTDARLSWLVGVAFRRFDERIVTGERARPKAVAAFDALPSRSPGMYPESDERTDHPDILVDDEGHTDDVATRAVAVADRVHVDVPDNLRGWLAKEFFPLHIKMYSKSRRKAPIYWQLATSSASYSVWLYIHAFTKDTLFRVQNEYAAPKLAHEERRLESLTSELRVGATAVQRKALAAQEALVEELRAFVDDVKRVAPLWKPNLDDGVIINFAPLWRLVPQNKSWQKELKSTWDAVCEAKYDWAHLAMHLWPERVVPKCAKDRSLAIAHGLEDVFWVEGADGKRTARKTPTRSVDELVRERTSPAVKSALKSLLEAPVASGKSTGHKGSGRRKAADAAQGGDA